MIIKRTLAVQDLNRFNDEAKLSNPAISIVLLFGDDDLRFTVSDDWGTADDTQLDNFITSFVDSDPEDKTPRIIDAAFGEAKSKHFHNINYTSNIEMISSLIPVREKVQGEVRKVTWYKTLDANQLPIEPVIVVDIAYTRDATGFALFRTTTRTYINRDGTENPLKKYSQKFYFVNKGDMIVEGYKRRKLLVQEIQIPALTYITEALMPLGYNAEAALFKGRAFMDDYELLFNKFVDNSSSVTDPADPNYRKKNIIVALENNASDGINKDHNEWLDKAPPSLGGTKTIRQWLIEEFNI